MIVQLKAPLKEHFLIGENRVKTVYAEHMNDELDDRNRQWEHELAFYKAVRQGLKSGEC